MTNTLRLILIILVVFTLVYLDKQVSYLSGRIEKIENKLDGIDRITFSEKDAVEKARRSTVRIVGGEGEGSGFALLPGGIILTNFHVIDGESSPKVVMTDNTFETGEVIMADKDADLAIIKIKKDIPVLKLAQNGKLQPADTLIAIGYPLGGDLPGESSIIKGAFSRIVKDKEAGILYIQTDMTMVSGMSGGPMINTYGEVVGINTSGLLLGGMGLSVSSDSIIERYKAMEASENPLKDVKPMVFLPDQCPLEAVRAFYNYLKVRQLEKAYALLSDNFLRGGSFDRWSIGYRPLLDTTVIYIKKDKKVEDRIRVKLSTKDLVKDEILYKYFEGYWDIRKVDGKWLLWHPRIRRVKDPGEDWFYDQDFIEEVREFAKIHDDLKKYWVLMYKLSQEPGNSELTMQELYDRAKEIIDSQKNRSTYGENDAAFNRVLYGIIDGHGRTEVQPVH